MRKKSLLPMNMLIILILVILIAIPLFIANDRLSKTIDRSGRIKACSSSILLAESSKRIPTKGGEPQIYLECPRGELLIKYDDVITKDKKIDQEKLNAIITKSLNDLWQAINQGKNDPFSDWKEDEDAEYKTMCIIWDKIVLERRLSNFLDNRGIALTYSLKNLYKESGIPKETKYPDVNITDGALIVAKEYKGMLQSSLHWYNLLGFAAGPIGGIIGLGITFAASEDDMVVSGFNYATGAKCEGCWYMWTRGIIPPEVSFSSIERELNGKEYRICDQIKN